jgi:hypothetical protein
MKPLLLIPFALAACHKHSAAPDSPVAAARCEAAAIQAKDFAVLAPCVLPELRDDLAAVAAQDRIDWAKYSAEQAKLEAAKPEDFQIRAVPDKDRAHGDQLASLKLGKDSLDVIHAPDGHWYIVDTGF